MPRGFWTCQRRKGGERCAWVNPNRKRKCEQCGKPRPPRKRPMHMSALALSYDYYVQINGGEHCGICGAEPKPGRRLDRDHEHKGVGTPRGLLCWSCNRQLKHTSTVEWLRAAAAYLERTARECDRCGKRVPTSYVPEYGAYFCDPCAADPQAASS
jgi:hypothetical protein